MERTEENAAIEAKELALEVADLLDERQGSDITILDVSGPLAIADFFVIATAKNLRHAQALSRDVAQTLKGTGLRRLNVAGVEGESGWMLLDFDEVVVHIFVASQREFYSLENLWADVPRVEFTPSDRPRQETGQPDLGPLPGVPDAGGGGFPEAGFSGA